MKNVLSGLTGFIIGAILGLCIYLIKLSIWKDEVPNWISNFRWLIATFFALVTIFICYLTGLEIEAPFIAAGIFISFANSFKNENNNNK